MKFELSGEPILSSSVIPDRHLPRVWFHKSCFNLSLHNYVNWKVIKQLDISSKDLILIGYCYWLVVALDDN